MTKHTSNAALRREKTHYIIGFTGAATLTVLAYASVTAQWFSATQTAAFVLVLAVLQLFVQSYYFLHLGDEPKPRWKSWSYLYSMVMMIIVVMGSLWVMYNLNYRMGMTGPQMEAHMLEQNKKGF